MRLWVTRTRPGAEATAARLAQMGHEAVIAPVLDYEVIPHAPLDLSRATAIAFTSQNAVSAFADLTVRRDLPVYAVGEATAAAARAIGFAEVHSADGAAGDLVDLILRHKPVGEVVWPGPVEPAADLVALLGAGGIAASLQPVYRTVERSEAVPEGIDGILVHSPRAARAIASLVAPALAEGLFVLTISDAAAVPLAKLPFSRVAVAPRPNETDLLDLLAG